MNAMMLYWAEHAEGRFGRCEIPECFKAQREPTGTVVFLGTLLDARSVARRLADPVAEDVCRARKGSR